MEILTGKIGGLGRLAGQSVAYAFRQLGNDRFRTFLALLGVSIGVFCVTAATSVVNSLQKTMRDGLKEFGTDAVFIEKIPIEPDLDEAGVFRWWKYISRPEPDIGDCRYLETKCCLAESVSFSAQYEGGKIIGVSEIWRPVVRNGLAEGRPFTIKELSEGTAVAIVGSNVETDNDGYIGIGDRKARIIGRFEESGINAVSLTDIDNAAVVPYSWSRCIDNLKVNKQTITVLPKSGVQYGMFLEELSKNMRKAHRIDISENDDFSINRLSFIMDEMNGLFMTISSIGWIIGLFSLVIGAFGITNIMFVSIKERTREIGLQKALGANRLTILIQFLAESSTLSVIGGTAGLFVAELVCLSIPANLIKISPDQTSALAALAVSMLIGVVAGIAPAAKAASMPPAEALGK